MASLKAKTRGDSSNKISLVSITDLPPSPLPINFRNFGDVDEFAAKVNVADIKEGALGHVDELKWWEDALCIATYLIFPGVLLWLWPLMAYMVYRIYHYSIFDYSFAVLLGIIALAVVPVKRDNREFVRSMIGYSWMRYFSLRVSWETILDKNRPYIMIVRLSLTGFQLSKGSPHGVYPFGQVVAGIFCATYADFTISGAVASLLLHVPFVRHILFWTDAVPATAHAIESKLKSNKAVGVSLGGVAELFESNDEHESIILRPRAGIFRLALRNGVPIVPAYFFGNTQSLHHFADKNGIMKAISRKIRAAITPFWGRYFLPIPHRSPVYAVVGTPIEVEKIAEPTKEDIQALQEKLISETERLFETHKRAYGWGHKRLIIK